MSGGGVDHHSSFSVVHVFAAVFLQGSGLKTLDHKSRVERHIVGPNHDPEISWTLESPGKD